MHRAAFTQAKSSMTDQARMLAGLCCLLQVCGSDLAACLGTGVLTKRGV